MTSKEQEELQAPTLPNGFEATIVFMHEYMHSALAHSYCGQRPGREGMSTKIALDLDLLWKYSAGGLTLDDKLLFTLQECRQLSSNSTHLVTSQVLLGPLD